MSFADGLREELLALKVKKPCCRRALTAGLLLGARTEENGTASVRFRQENVASLASETIRQQYGKTPELCRTGLCGHTFFDLSFSAPAFRKTLTELRAGDKPAGEVLRFSCEGCAPAFLRGAYLAAGTVNDPHRSIHMEFVLPDAESASALSSVLEENGLTPGRITRGSGVGLYFKNRDAVEGLTALMGAHHLIFEMMNSRIECEIRNNENRATNCDTKNIGKVIAASEKQIAAINRLMETGKLDSLPEPLRVTAMLRYRNPEVSLDELATMHEPCISKSGLNHRLQKLISESEE